MTESDAIVVVQEELFGPASLPVRIRRGEGLHREGLQRLRGALASLIDRWRLRSAVPKSVAAAMVDLATFMDPGRHPYPEEELQAIEDATEELVALAYALFSVPVDVAEAADPAKRAALAQRLFRFVPRRDLPKLPPDAIVHDVSSSARPPWVKLSPFYPHGGIPVPGQEEATADSVEGIWQGLKILDGETDPSFFTGKGRKRRGRPSGHRFGARVLGYVDARRLIYIPSYEYLWRECIGQDLRRLLFGPAAEGVVQYFHDFEDNGDPADASAPLAHASLLVRLAAEELASTMELVRRG
ncbi:MAG TPA: hypothetical protein VEB43_12905 [Anaeromyxobacter sp.]|nr:hypothetical protein [Anaeromyxobacter sp.]